MPATLYKLIHFFGIFMFFLSIGGALVYAATSNGAQDWKKKSAMFHGISLFLVLLGGFGMLARYSIPMMTGWVLAKLVIWVIFGGILSVISRKADLSKALWWTTLILGGLAAYLGIMKPF